VIQVVDDVIQIPVFQTQFFQLLAQCLDLVVCQLVVDGRGSCSRPG
jgi:hypothetical protein